MKLDHKTYWTKNYITPIQAKFCTQLKTSKKVRSTDQAILDSQKLFLAEKLEYCQKWQKIIKNLSISVINPNWNTTLQYKNSNQMITK